MSELVGKTVTTGKRNVIQNQDMAPGDISLPVKPYEYSPVTAGKRDTPLDAGGSAVPGGMTTK